MSFTSPSPPKRLRRRERSHNATENIAPTAASTPYNTPFKSRNQSLCHPNVKDARIKKAVSQLKGLLNKQWYIFNVSPLFNMDYTEVSLKRYARRLKTKLASRLSDTSAVEYDVSYEPYNLQLNDNDHKALEISVEKIMENGNRSIAYNAILLSWGAEVGLQPENAVFLPILICHGLKTIIKQVHSEFQLLHDCFVNSFDLCAEEIRLLCVGIFNNSSYLEKDVIKLRYCLPQNMKSGVFDISLPTFVLSNLWKCIHKNSAKEWTDDEVTTFWTEIHNHTYRAFGIDLGNCVLYKVSLPDIAFTHEAVLLKKKEHMYLVLSYLMSLQNHLTTVVPLLHEAPTT